MGINTSMGGRYSARGTHLRYGVLMIMRYWLCLETVKHCVCTLYLSLVLF